MSSLYIECPSCNTEGKVDASLLGSRIKCLKCGHPFVVEVGGSYDVVAPEPAPATEPERPAPRASSTSAKGRSGKATPKPEATKSKAADPALDTLMERWAEE
jgi:predicted Zn finger-like uncharacterized protein